MCNTCEHGYELSKNKAECSPLSWDSARNLSWGYARNLSWDYARNFSWDYARNFSWDYARNLSWDYARNLSWDYARLQVGPGDSAVFRGRDVLVTDQNLRQHLLDVWVIADEGDMCDVCACVCTGERVGRTDACTDRRLDDAQANELL